MPVLFLQYSRLAVSVSAPDRLIPELRRNFAPALAAAAPPQIHHRFDVTATPGGLSLLAGGTPLATFPALPELMFFLEERLENALIERLGDWVGLHAGAAVIGEAAIVVVGRPDTGKTTSMFQLAELGLELLSEEVTPIDPATGLVHAFPQVLTLDRAYVEQFVSLYPVEHGSLDYHGERMARYTPRRFHARPERLAAIVFPTYAPACEPEIGETRPSVVLTDLLQCCFPPSGSDERLFDAVIGITERCRLFRLRSADVASARRLLRDLVTRLS